MGNSPIDACSRRGALQYPLDHHSVTKLDEGEIKVEVRDGADPGAPAVAVDIRVERRDTERIQIMAALLISIQR